MEHEKVDRWTEYYGNYELLKNIINDIASKRPLSEKLFTNTLEKEWSKYLEFVRSKIDEITSQSTENLEKESIVEILEVNRFVTQNQEMFQKVIKKHDKVSSYKFMPSWQWKIKYDPTKKLFGIIKKISEQYCPKENLDEPKLDADNFTRKSIKYWVKKENTIPLILKIIKHLPIFVWDEEINDYIYQKIQSVYFDNEECGVFHERVDKLNESKLIRLRWYQDSLDTIFVERKVHYDDWTMKQSSKDRFRIENYNVMSFLKGDIEINEELANEIQQIILTKNLYPKIRTAYKRIAFQLPHTNDVRISLDIDLRMIREKVSYLQWHTEEDNILTDDLYMFPHQILEVKLVGKNIENPPDWIRDILESGLVIEQPFFSKFIHASYIFYSHKCNKVPIWFETDKEYFEKSLIKYSGGKRMDVAIDIPDSNNNSVNNSPLQVVPRRRNWLICCPSKEKKNKVSVPMKIEPKTFFANERTFLQWFNAAAFLASVGMALLGMGEMPMGIIMMTIAGGVICYANYIYRRRGIGLVKRIDVGYHDQYGPYILSIVMGIGLIASIILKVSL
jgi:SPX domain protein involved in polyphosphate accumulation